jgi:uncharacterized protein YgfB (UPF0149 family)
MHDDLIDEVAVFDFDELAGHLLEQGALASPSQVHGCLCGLLSAGAPVQAEYGLDALAQALDLVLHGELASRIMQLYTVSEAALQDEEFTFFPLLPDDEEDIAQRTVALASWCDGFLSGFAYAAAGEKKTDGPFSELCSEALRDIAALAQAEAAEDEGNDEEEEHYIELVEYLRVAVVNVFLDSFATGQGQELSPEAGQPLH